RFSRDWSSAVCSSDLGWIYLRTDRPGQRFFDFGQDATRHFSAAPVGADGQKGFLTLITSENGRQARTTAPSIATNKWVHLAFVIDVPAKSMMVYADGKRIGGVDDVPSELTTLFGLQ